MTDSETTWGKTHVGQNLFNLIEAFRKGNKQEARIQVIQLLARLESNYSFPDSITVSDICDHFADIEPEETKFDMPCCPFHATGGNKSIQCSSHTCADAYI